MSYYNGPKIITNGLMLCLDAGNSKSYPGSGTVWTDISRNGNNGTTSGNPTFSSANGGSIVFDGVDDKVLFNATNFPVNYTKISVFKANDTNVRNLFSSSSPVDHAFWLNSGSLNAGHNGSYSIVSTPISTGVWYFGAVTYNNNFIALGAMILYLNGRRVSSGNAGALSTGGDYKIGEHSSGQSFNGNIAITMLYNQILSPGEILQNYNALKGRFGL